MFLEMIQVVDHVVAFVSVTVFNIYIEKYPPPPPNAHFSPFFCLCLLKSIRFGSRTAVAQPRDAASTVTCSWNAPSSLLPDKHKKYTSMSSMKHSLPPCLSRFPPLQPFRVSYPYPYP